MAEGPPPEKPLADRFYPRQIPPGGDLSRIISLSDGVFAFALTLLVLSLAVPSFPSGLTSSELSGHLGRALQRDYPAFLGYAFAFFMIATWWVVHHRTFSYIRRYTGVLIGINMALLLEIAVMPFVLTVYSLYSETQVAVALFSATQAITGLTAGALWGYATYHHQLVDPELDDRLIRYYRLRGLVTPVVFGLAFAVSFVSVLGAEIVWVGALIAPRFAERYGIG